MGKFGGRKPRVALTRVSPHSFFAYKCSHLQMQNLFYRSLHAYLLAGSKRGIATGPHCEEVFRSFWTFYGAPISSCVGTNSKSFSLMATVLCFPALR